MTSDARPGDDPEPQPPQPPEPWECCQSGCQPCVYDRYWDALTLYEQRLRDWRARHSPAAEM